VCLNNVNIVTQSNKPLSPFELIVAIAQHNSKSKNDKKDNDDDDSGVVSDVVNVVKSDAVRKHGQKILNQINPHWRFKLGEW
jgi:hypothetical protein